MQLPIATNPTYLQPWHTALQNIVGEHPSIVQELAQLAWPTSASGQVEAVVEIILGQILHMHREFTQVTNFEQAK